MSASGAFTLLSLALAGASAPAKPQRILSTNLCADQLLLQLVEPERIAGLSHLAADPELSALSERARGLPLVRPSAEEAFLRRPDLALVGKYWAREAVHALRELGVPLVEVAPVESFEAVRKRLTQVARAVGEEERGQRLLAEFDAELAALRARRTSPAPRAALVQSDGTTMGRGALVDEVFTAAGFRNVSADMGLAAHATIDLERLLLSSPDLLVMPRYRAEAPTLARERGRHPALSSGGIPELSVPFALIVCGTTETVRVVRQLVEWREQWGRAP